MWLTTSFESFDGEDVGYDEGLGDGRRGGGLLLFVYVLGLVRERF
jgi:hypothetical protein